LIAPDAPQPQAYCTALKYSFNSPVPLLKRLRSQTETVLISFGSTTESPETLKRRRAIASQWQIICCTVSASCLQNLQAGIPFEQTPGA
jgi:hypothetical protein